MAHREEKEEASLFKSFSERINHYVSFEHISLKASKQSAVHDQLKEEAAAIQKKVNSGNDLVLLDSNGKQFSSVEFARWLQKKQNTSRDLVFVIGSAYGFDEALKKSAAEMISLSKMTFPHQLAKVMFAEQLYRAFTILRNEKYHH